MFLAPAVIAALGYEFASAIKSISAVDTKGRVNQGSKATAVEEQPAAGPAAVPREPTAPTNQPTESKDHSLDHAPMTYTVQEPSEALTVFGPRNKPVVVTSNQQGVINAVCSAVSQLSPVAPSIVRSVCELAARALIEEGKKVNIPNLMAKVKKQLTKSKKAKKHGNATQQGQSKGVPPSVAGLGYTNAPVAVSRQVKRTSKPRMKLRGDTMCISHSEMIGSIMSGTPTSNVTGYKCIGFRANPGISSVFPWLSSVAVNYEKYRFRKLSFTIVPLVATNFSGRIGVGFDYDSTDVAPGNRQEFYALTTHVENMPWEAATLNVKVDPIYKFTGTHTASDNKLIDLGQVLVMSDAISNGGTISSAIALYDLLVDYEVELIEPQQALFASQSFNTSSPLIAGVPLGTGTDTTGITGPSVIEATTVTAGTVQFTIPAGTYLVSSFCAWSTGAAGFSLTSPTAGVVLKSTSAAGTSFGYSIGTVSSTVEFLLNLNATTVTFTANLNRFNVIITRVASTVAAALVV